MGLCVNDFFVGDTGVKQYIQHFKSSIPFVISNMDWKNSVDLASVMRLYIYYLYMYIIHIYNMHYYMLYKIYA